MMTRGVMGARLPILGILCSLVWMSPVRAEEREHEETFITGTGRFVGGLCLEFPLAVFDVTESMPPLVTAGLFAGVIHGSRIAFQGLQEANRGFDPWGAKQIERERARLQKKPAHHGTYVTPGFPEESQ